MFIVNQAFVGRSWFAIAWPWQWATVCFASDGGVEDSFIMG